MPERDLDFEMRRMQSEIDLLKIELAGLKVRTEIISPKFLRRAFAVFGHNFVASLIVSLPFYILVVLLFGMGALVGG